MTFDEIIKGISRQKAIIFGDMMLDSYLWGKVQRISPEAPVPVIEIEREEHRPGGAANVAINITALGAKAYPIGIIGKDESALSLHKLFVDMDIETSGLIVDETRKTTTKTRIGAANQQIVRIDIEDLHHPCAAVEKLIIAELECRIPQVGLLIVEDYNKGLLSENIIAKTLELCKKHCVIVAVDPKQKNFFSYRGVDIFKPNYSELQTNLGRKFENETDFYQGANEVLERLECRYLVVTRGSQGMHIFSKDEPMRHLPSFAREVYDVSGAGDTVITALGLAYLAGAGMLSAATFANHAAGVVCGKLGTAFATPEEILRNADSKE
ncbi:MAG: D-glycero-beta-D-manno-heptose-7-phosphate kinase [Candidatus Cloacimonetes bacterium]|jgi:D-beta-D-heptose 7-phosphate kinase/D-beta-D-heptose 1-phosphate adenosyltransferase|nr:D-glycero-beta-D-manno-heptose-7-phosphate kinase [Candidatus Cloacimonadota bacterium]